MARYGAAQDLGAEAKGTGAYSGGEGGQDDIRENYRNTPAAKASAKKAATISKANKIKDNAKPKFIPSILANVVKGLGKMVTVGRQKNAEVKANNALFGTSDYQGNVKKADFSTPGNDGDNNNNNNTPIIIKKNIGGNTIKTTAPTEAEVSQSEAANADATALKNKKRGRSMMMMSGSKGVTKTSPDYSLGKTSLLGRV